MDGCSIVAVGVDIASNKWRGCPSMEGRADYIGRKATAEGSGLDEKESTKNSLKIEKR